MWRRNCLLKADEVVRGGRQDDYGHPAETAGAVADLWTAYLRPKLREGEEVAPIDVPFMMVLLKLARERGNPGAVGDNLVDMAGYVRTAEMIYDGEGEGR